MRKEISQTFAFTDVSLIPSRRLQLQFKRILEAYSFKPISAPEEKRETLSMKVFSRSSLSF